MTGEWRNWSGSVSCSPVRLAQPQDEEETVALVREAIEQGWVVRPAGAGHSFTPICATDDLLFDLAGLSGIAAIGAGEATIRAGTRIKDLGVPLLEVGLALENQGDVDVQAIAGALATGTHGTGPSLGNLSTRLVGLRLIDGTGSVRDIGSSDRDLLRCARVSLGLMGVVLTVRLQLVPAYRLHERLWTEPIDQTLDRLDERIAATRHYEFFWYPGDGLARNKALHPTDLPPGSISGAEGERIDYSFRIFPSIRDNKFNEMEYAIPADEGPACFGRIRRLMRERHGEALWPVEYRTVAADDSPISPAYGRPTVTISIHQGAALPHEGFFRDAERVFREHAGRPHWGKIHYLAAPDLCSLYPEWDLFERIRGDFDPAGLFLNEHLADRLGTRGSCP